MGSVDQKIQKNLVKLMGIAADRKDVSVFSLQNGHVLDLIPDDIDGALQARVDVGNDHLVPAAMREYLQVSYDLFDPLSPFGAICNQLPDIL